MFFIQKRQNLNETLITRQFQAIFDQFLHDLQGMKFYILMRQNNELLCILFSTKIICFV